MTKGNYNNREQNQNIKDDLNGGPVEERLDSDNAFSDKGLNNHRLTREAVKKSNSNR